MKLFIVLATLMGSLPALAIPVMNENMANSQQLTLFPDHKDPNRFYVGPNFAEVHWQEGKPLFSYREYKKRGRLFALVNVILKGQYHQEEYERVKKEVLAKKPGAQFSVLPFVSSKIVFNPTYADLIDGQSCEHNTAQIGDEISCVLRLNRKGRKYFLSLVRQHLAFVFNFEYEVQGCARTAEGQCDQAERIYGVAARIGDEGLADFPELFLNKKGRPIF